MFPWETQWRQVGRRLPWLQEMSEALFERPICTEVSALKRPCLLQILLHELAINDLQFEKALGVE